MIKTVKKFLSDYLDAIVVVSVSIICILFLIFGNRAEDGSITLDGSNAKIEEYTEKFIESANQSLYRLMNEDKPTDDSVYVEATGKGGSTSLEAVLSRRIADGNNDGGSGWQCSRYTGWLATGQWSYSSSHPDYGPRNGKDMAQWLVDNFGWKYIDEPITGAIGSGGFNTLYGHTAMFLYSTGEHTAMVNDANYVPLTVATHDMNIDGWRWVVPSDYEPDPIPEPEPDVPSAPDTGTIRGI